MRIKKIIITKIEIRRFIKIIGIKENRKKNRKSKLAMLVG